MAMNVARAANQAASLRGCSSDIYRAINYLRSYKNTVMSNYQSTEVRIIASEIDEIINLLSQTASSLDSAGAAVHSTASKIRSREIARINAAKKALDLASAVLRNLNRQRTNLQRQITYTTDQNMRIELNRQLNSIVRQCNSAQRNYNSCLNEYNAAIR